jgi:hypothetical protein
MLGTPFAMCSFSCVTQGWDELRKSETLAVGVFVCVWTLKITQHYANFYEQGK